MNLLMNLRKSFYCRLKSLVRREEFRKILERNGLSQHEFADVPSDLVEIMETVRNFRRKSDVLLDVGAYKGQFSKVANALFQFKQTVCFEPNAQMHDFIRANNQSKAVHAETIALSDATGGEATLFLHQDPTMNSTVDSDGDVLRKEFPYDNPDAITTTRVKTITLDDYVAAQDWGNAVFLMKLDTQGSELNILRHGVQALKQTEICLVEYMFTTPYKCDFTFYELVDFMRNNNFRCEGALSVSKRASGKISSVDFLFVQEM